MKPLLVFAALVLASGTALARDVYKCVDANGNVSFSDTSCPGSDSGAAQGSTPSVRAGAASSTSQAARPSSAPAAVPPRAQQPRGSYGSFIDRSRQMPQGNDAGGGPR